METWLSENYGTILISALLLAAVILIIWFRIRAKKQGRPSCGGNCGHCGGACHCSTGKNK